MVFEECDLAHLSFVEALDFTLPCFPLQSFHPLKVSFIWLRNLKISLLNTFNTNPSQQLPREQDFISLQENMMMHDLAFSPHVTHINTYLLYYFICILNPNFYQGRKWKEKKNKKKNLFSPNRATFVNEMAWFYCGQSCSTISKNNCIFPFVCKKCHAYKCGLLTKSRALPQPK